MKKLHRKPDVNWRVESHREAHVREVLEDPLREDEDAEALEVGTVTILAGGGNASAQPSGGGDLETV